MSEGNNIDKIFREHSNAFAPKVPDGSWDSIAGSLQANRRRKVFWLWAACIVGFLLIPASLYFVLTPAELKAPLAERALIAEKAVVAIIPADTSASSTPITQIDSMRNLTIIPLKKKVLLPQNEVSSNQKYEVLPSDLSPTASSLSGDTATPNMPEEPLPIEALSVLSDSVKDDEPTQFAVSPMIPIDSILPREEKKYSSRFWLAILGGQAGSYRSGGELHNSGAQVASASDQHLSSSVFSFELGLALTPRISIHTGLHKGRFGNVSEFVVNEADLRFVKIDRFGESSSGLFTASKINSLVKSSGIQSLSEMIAFSKMKVEYVYLDIPFGARFTLLHKRNIDVVTGSGMNLSVLCENSVSLLKGTEWFEVGKVENLRKSLFGMNANVGLNYSIGSALQLSLQTGFCHYFTSVSYNKSYDYRPYTYEVLVGLRYRIKR